MGYRLEDICYGYDTKIRQITGNYTYDLMIRIIEKAFNALEDRYIDMLVGNVVFIGITDYGDRFKSGEYCNQISFTTSELAVDVGLYSDCFSEVGDFDIRLGVVTYDTNSRGLYHGLLPYEEFEEWTEVSVVVDDEVYGSDSDIEFLLAKAHDEFNFVMLNNRDKLAIQNIERVEFGVHDNGMVLKSNMYPCMVIYYFDSFGSCTSFVYEKTSFEELFETGLAPLKSVENYINY